MTAGPGIVLVTTSYPVWGDGSEAAGSFVSDLAEQLATHCPVRVVAPGPTGGREIWSAGVEVLRYVAPDRPLSTLRPWKPADALAIARLFAGGMAATRQAVMNDPTAHILALWALPSGHWARRVSRASGVPYSVWTLGSDIWTLGRVPLIRGWLRRVLRQARVCYSDGLQLAQDTRRIAGRPVEFLPSTRRIEGTRTAPFRDAPPFRLLFLGRWHPNKGVDLLIEALRRLDEEDWRRIEAVEICGGGPLEPLVRAGVESLRAAGHPVELRGFLDKPAAAEAMLRADYLLIPSRIESIPVVFSDAMKLGCPVVAMPVGDLPRLIGEHDCGLLASRADGAAFAAAIGAALERSPSVFEAGVARARERFALPPIARGLHQRLCPTAQGPATGP